MKILKARNGIALVAVLVIMLVSSMFIPVMFNLSDSALYTAVKGTDRQRVSYLARTITEMSVAAFKSFESTDHLRCQAVQVVPNSNPEIATTEGYYISANGETVCYSCGAKKSDVGNGTDFYKIANEYEKLLNKEIDSIKTDVVVMFQKDNADKQPVYYIEYLDEDGEPISEKTKISYDRYVDLARALLEYIDKYGEDEPLPYTLYPEINPADPANPIEIEEEDIEDIKYVSCTVADDGSLVMSSDDAERVKGYKEVGRGYCTITYDTSVTYFKTNVDTKQTIEINKDGPGGYEEGLASVIKGTQKEWSYSKKENRNVKFVSTAEVNGFKSSRTCVLVLPTYPSEEDWLEFGIADPNKPGELIASGGNQVFVDPDKATSRVPIKFENVLGDTPYIYQNLLVYSAVGNMVIRPTSYKNAANANKLEYAGEQNSQFVLGVQPGLNTTPNNDPTYEIIDAVNYADSTEVAQMNNFVAFSATNALQVDMPVNLLVNPCRANRIGDNALAKKNGSLYKIMVFQAPVIQFNERLDMMMSFYARQNNAVDQNARRMSSIVLSAPSNTPYSYLNESRGEVVKAGMVYFTEDCYLWIIEPMDDGSASSGWGFLAETVYERDSDFTVEKIANAGDVYYFNSEIQVDGKDVGFSLTGYYIETEYFDSLGDTENKNFWQRMKGSFYESQLTKNYTQTYKKDDFYYLGNLNEGSFNVEPPKTDGYYTYWVN